jgi:anion transporter
VSDVFSGFSNSIVLLVFGALVVGDAMNGTGLDRVIGNFVIRISKDNERVFIFVAALVSGVMSMWMANTAVVAVFLPVIVAVSSFSKNMALKNLVISVTFGAMYGGSCTLVGSTPQLTAQGIFSPLYPDLTIKIFDYFPVGFTILVVYLIWTQVAGYALGKKIWGKRLDEGISEASLPRIDNDTPIDKARCYILTGIYVLMVSSFMFEWYPAALTSILAALLCFITGCTSVEHAFKRLDWNSLFLLALTLGIANGLSKAGMGEWLGAILAEMLGETVNPTALFAAFVLASLITSNFAANSTTVLIYLPLALSLCSQYGLNPVTFTLGIVYAANLACATPVAHPQVTMTLVGGYRFTDYALYNMPMQIMVYLIVVFLTPVFFPLAL